jgi:hypothetical protein
VGGPTRYEAPTDLAGGIQLASGKRAGASDGIPRPVVVRGLGFEQCQNAFGAVRRPGRDEAPVSFAQ